MRRVNYVAKPGQPPVRYVGIVNRVSPFRAGGKARGRNATRLRAFQRVGRSVYLRLRVS